MSTIITPNHAAAATPSPAVAAQHEGPGLPPALAPQLPRGPHCEMEMRDWWRDKQGEEWRLL